MTVTTAVYHNTYQFSADVAETAHEGHEVEVGKRHEVDEPGNVWHNVTCLVDGVEFSAFPDEILVNRQA